MRLFDGFLSIYRRVRCRIRHNWKYAVWVIGDNEEGIHCVRFCTRKGCKQIEENVIDPTLKEMYHPVKL